MRSFLNTVVRTASPLLAASLLAAPAAAPALDLQWQPPGAGDWFDATNWDGGVVPGPADQASIANGGTAEATAADVDVGQLLLGADPLLGPTQSGTLEVSGGDVVVGSTTAVGVAQSGTTSAAGTLVITGGALTTNGLAVGQASETNATATGSVDVSGAIGVVGFGGLFLGTNTGVGSTAQGTVSGASYSGNHAAVLIGRDDAGGAGTGSLVVTDSLSLGTNVTFLEVGLAVRDGLSADGTLRAGSGDVVTSRTTSIGAHVGDRTAVGDARGEVSLGGTLANTGTSTLRVGDLASLRSGTAEGSLSVAGLSGYGTQRVGVADGVSGSATGTLTVGTGGLSGGALDVGRAGTASADGTVTVADGGLGLTNRLIVGTTDGAGSASGVVQVSGGDVTFAGTMSVGNVLSSAPATSASGTLSSAGAISGATGSLLVGSNTGAGSTAQGTVSGASYSGDHIDVVIGRDDAGGGGTGSLVVTDSLSLGTGVRFLEVGLTVETGVEAHGTLRGGGSADLVTSRTTSIGAHFGDRTAVGDARGEVSLGGTLANTGTSTLRVGDLASLRSGTAEGSLSVAGLSGYGTQRVGVADGVSGSATGTLTVGTGGLSGGALDVGRAGTASADGTVTVADGGLGLTNRLIVGTTDGAGSASGVVQVSGGDVTFAGTMSVGNVLSSAPATSASGTLSSAGAISGATGSLLVGSNTGAGSTAQGTVSGASYSGDHGSVLIGRDDAGGGGTGSLVVTDSLSLGAGVTFLEVGLAVRDGLSADGTLRAGSGDVVTSRTTSIGAHFGDRTGVGDARGEVSLGGTLTNTVSAVLRVGDLAVERSGAAEGSLSVAGLSGYGLQRVGVADGSSGSATGTLTVGAGGLTGSTLLVGRAGAASADGTVTVAGGGVDLGTGVLLVGTATGEGGTANGLMSAAGGLRLDRGVGVGTVDGLDPTSAANGSLQLTGGVLDAGNLNVGRVVGRGHASGELVLDGVNGSVTLLVAGGAFGSDASADGQVRLSGSVLDVEEVIAIGSGSGIANAGLTMTDSRLVVGNGTVVPGDDGDLFLGSRRPGSSAELALRRSLVEVSDRLIVQENAVLDLHVEGTVRGSEYGALDTQTAFLGGALEVNFDFAGVAAGMVFDLVVSGLLDGIAGDFASVSVLGLDPALAATAGVVVDNVAGADVEIYRLSIVRAAVPEPATAILLLLALAGLSARPRRG